MDIVDFFAWLTMPIWGPVVFLLQLFSDPNEETIKIAILGGSKGCGKSELWNQLRGTKNPGKPTEQTRIESFVIGKKQNGVEVTVETTKDLGGGGSYVSSYEEIVNSDGVFVYFLIDLRTLERDKREIRGRLRKIGAIIEQHEYKNCGINIVGTFYDKYRGLLALRDKEDAKNEILQVLTDGHKTIKGIKKEKMKIRIINTTNKQDIDEIRNEILKTI